MLTNPGLCSKIEVPGTSTMLFTGRPGTPLPLRSLVVAILTPHPSSSLILCAVTPKKHTLVPSTPSLCPTLTPVNGGTGKRDLF